MKTTHLQHHVAQSAQVTSTLLMFIPLFVMTIPLTPVFLLYFLLRSLRTSFSWFVHQNHGLTKQQLLFEG